MHSRMFFVNFGKLLYAIAASDGDIATRERTVLFASLESIAKKHHRFVSDDFKAGLWLSKIVFLKAVEIHLPPSIAVQEFDLFWKNAKHDTLNPAESEVCIDLLQHIASANHGIGQVEKNILTESIQMFKKDKIAVS
jgi:hypothetical protein